jgi:hypothetical protein
VAVQPAPAPTAAANPGANGAPGADDAEHKVDRVANRVGYMAAYGARTLGGWLSRTREALQDFWAEVQDFRHGRKP